MANVNAASIFEPWRWKSESVPKSLTLKGALVATALLLQCVQLLALSLRLQSLWISNVVQVLLPILALYICLKFRLECRNHAERSLWSKLALAFFFWTVAELLYLAELYFLRQAFGVSWPDDVLWLLFALPILVVTSVPSDAKRDWVSWLDQGQAFIFFVIVLLSVFCSPHIFAFDTAYNFQNLVLLLSCLFRVSVSTTRSAIRFYRDLGVYLFIYTFHAALGNSLQNRGWVPGTMVDLCWTIPLTTFCLLVCRKRSPHESRLDRRGASSVRWNKHIHGLSALGLAVLSIGASAAVIARRPSIGWVCLVGTFSMFAARTLIREQQLHRAHDQLEVTVLQDALTGLGNRLQFRRYLKELVDSVDPSDSIALMFVDLDQFKSINDEFGHEVGDLLLVEVASRLQGGIRTDGLACRMGGDEFVVVLKVANVDAARRVALRLMDAIRTPLCFGSRCLRVTASIGVVIGNSNGKMEEFLHEADHAMYRAKRLGRNQVQVFESFEVDLISG